jgi:hypothetical protein
MENMDTKLAILIQNTAFMYCKNMDIPLILEKIANFYAENWPTSPKMAIITLAHEGMKKFLQTHPPITKTIRFFYTLFAHVSTLTWVLFRCSFTTELIRGVSFNSRRRKFAPTNLCIGAH